MENSDKIFRQKLQKYIEENYIDENKNSNKFYPSAMLYLVAGIVLPAAPVAAASVANGALIADKNDISAAIAKAIANINKKETFPEVLRRLIEKKTDNPAEIYRNAKITRQTYSKIMNGTRPQKNTVIAFAFALKLDYDETQNLLFSANYFFTNTDLSDVIITFFIKEKIFDIDELNKYLTKYNQPEIGHKKRK